MTQDMAVSTRGAARPRGGARKLVRRVHLALALGCGAVLALVGLSGALLAVYQPILALEYGAEMFGPRDAGPPRPIAEWAGALATGDPAVNGLSEIVVARAAPLPNDRPMLLVQTADTARIIVVDPDTARPVGSFTLEGSRSALIYYFHSQLLLSDTGITLVSLASIGLLLSVGSGLYLWWPRGSLLAAVKPKPVRGFASLLQWHNLVGVYALAGLVVLSVSGIWLARPGWIEPLVSPMSAIRAPVATGQADDCPGNLTFAQAADVAQRHAPGAEVTFIGLEPDDGSGEVFEIYMRRSGDLNQRLGDIHLEVGRHCPVVLAALPSDLTMGEQLRQSMLGLHNGRIIGVTGIILVVGAGLALALLFGTGLILWVKRKGRERRVRTATAPLGAMPGA